MGGALFYPSVKRSPCFAFCERQVCAGCPVGKIGLLFLLAFKRKKYQRLRRAFLYYKENTNQENNQEFTF